MSQKPKIAIVGRPNVGKSALFNRICNKKIAIVDEAEGITRDRLYADGDLFGLAFEIIDTGGIDNKSKADFNAEIKRQAEIAIEEADSIIQVVDTSTGLNLLDKEVAKVLLRTKKPVIIAANKVDNLSQVEKMHQFYSLGIKTIVPVSAAQGWQIAELLEAALAPLPKAQQIEVDDGKIKLAIVGRPNVGKSSLVNYLLSEDRCIVSPIAGTTRDSVDLSFSKDDVNYTLIDTAGIRRKGAEHEVVDKFASIRTDRAIERCDICLLMLDAQKGITAQDKKIANKIEEAGKGCIILLNKWDLVKGYRMEHCLKAIEETVPFLKHCPKIFISVAIGRNIEKIFDQVKVVYENTFKRITTHQLNKFVSQALQKNHPPMLGGKRLRIYYMAQVETAPPKFIFFVNSAALMVDSYKKYLYNQFREEYDFTGVPLQMHLKGKAKKREDEGAIKPQKPDRLSHKNEHLTEVGDKDEFDIIDEDSEF